MKLFFDTETTGKADFRAHPGAAHQPRLVQLGALLTDEAGAELASLNCIVRPEGFDIPEAASAIHGITNVKANSCGITRHLALSAFRELWEMADGVVAHNSDFDVLIINGEFHRLLDLKAPLKPQSAHCTMRAMTPVCKLPGKWGDFKWPKLQEAYKHAFGSEFDGAHDAMADVRACAKVYFWLRKREASFRQAVDACPLPLADAPTNQLP